MNIHKLIDFIAISLIGGTCAFFCGYGIDVIFDTQNWKIFCGILGVILGIVACLGKYSERYHDLVIEIFIVLLGGIFGACICFCIGIELNDSFGIKKRFEIYCAFVGFVLGGIISGLMLSDKRDSILKFISDLFSKIFDFYRKYIPLRWVLFFLVFFMTFSLANTFLRFYFGLIGFALGILIDILVKGKDAFSFVSYLIRNIKLKMGVNPNEKKLDKFYVRKKLRFLNLLSVLRGDDSAGALLMLFASILQDGNRVKDVELLFIKHYFTDTYNKKYADYLMTCFKNVFNSKIHLFSVCDEFCNKLKYSERLKLVYELYRLANVDKKFTDFEREILSLITKRMNITKEDIQNLDSIFDDWVDYSDVFEDEDLSEQYKILEIDKSASEDEIKHAYKKLAVKYHPDKVSYLGEKAQKKAEQRFKEINEAYEILKKARGFK